MIIKDFSNLENLTISECKKLSQVNFFFLTINILFRKLFKILYFIVV